MAGIGANGSDDLTGSPAVIAERLPMYPISAN
jgi:hypothetical protein